MVESQTLQPEAFEGMQVKGVTMEALVGMTEPHKDLGIGAISYCLVTLNENPNQKFLAVVEEGSNGIELIEVGDVEEAGEAMIEYYGRRRGIWPPDKDSQ